MQNVVTYTVVVQSPNKDLKLLPGMTASLAFQIEKRTGVLRLPNATLRFLPKPDDVCPEDRALLETDADADAAPVAKSKSAAVASRITSAAEHAKKRVWVLRDGLLAAVQIVSGLNDTGYTEVVSGPLGEGQQVVIGARAAEAAGTPPASH